MRRPALFHPLQQALILVAIPAVIGLVVNGLRTEGIDLRRPVLAASGSAAATCEIPLEAVAEIDVAQARRLHESGAIFIDARQASAYAGGHVPGALHLPSVGECPDGPAVIAGVRAVGSAVVYDDGGSCALARRLADRLIDEGVAEVQVMLGGFDGWQDVGAPAASGLCEACQAFIEEVR